MFYTRDQLKKEFENNKHISDIVITKYNNQKLYFRNINCYYSDCNSGFDNTCEDYYSTKHELIGKYYFISTDCCHKFPTNLKHNNYEIFFGTKKIIFDLMERYYVFFKTFDDAFKFKTKIIEYDCYDYKPSLYTKEDNLIKNIYREQCNKILNSINKISNYVGQTMFYKNNTLFYEGKNYKDIYLLK